MARAKSRTWATRAGLGVAGLALSVLAASAQVQPPPATDGIYGVWRNPKGSVHVEIKPCGPEVCGYVVWANDEARTDARKGSGGELLGRQLLRDFTPSEKGEWRGKVFAPDVNMTFSGRVLVLDAGKLRAKGCVLGNFLCKTQVWTRVA
ncbi:DUF2147 domain-containing protein [Caulobacter sp. 602-2]|uniref:DUF2147 domain-containing protein n=1 Tax=Caulobacter sp. 602-2 TaxID=2710887 RepID=A0A6G4QT82_9CAUL|nr:DUF2147 domain-containing protein [Caulobacter sp. 602-2]NGM48465.1 DUF2147 domain-containing protein [Caulobacter sp. 602-2]